MTLTAKTLKLSSHDSAAGLTGPPSPLHNGLGAPFTLQGHVRFLGTLQQPLQERSSRGKPLKWLSGAVPRGLPSGHGDGESPFQKGHSGDQTD